MNTVGFKKYFNLFGSILSLLGILFVVLRLRDYGIKVNFEKFTVISWLTLVSLSILYFFSNTLLAFGWHRLLCYYGLTPTRLWAVRVYGFSQLAKYVPGNIFHLAGRQSLGMAAGYPGWALVKSSCWELAICLLGGAVFSVLLVPFMLDDVSITITFVVFFLLISVVCLVLKFYFSIDVARSFIYFLFFFIVTALLFVLLVSTFFTISHSNSFLFPAIGGAYITAWLIGFVTPGAPAGMGVRELVLIFLLNRIMSENDLILSAMLMRFVTVFGDILFFCFAVILKKYFSNLLTV